MSAVTVSAGSARISAQLQDLLGPPSWVIENVHLSSEVCGVGPADSTGKSLVTYWPGGTRPSAPAGVRRRPWNPREIGLIESSPLRDRREALPPHAHGPGGQTHRPPHMSHPALA